MLGNVKLGHLADKIKKQRNHIVVVDVPESSMAQMVQSDDPIVLCDVTIRVFLI